MAYEYNLVVIGAGSAGLVSAFIGSAIKAKVALIEKHKMGGDCLNTGCVPSKAFIRSAKVASEIKRAGEFGIDAGPSKIEFTKVMDRVRSIIKKIEPHDSIERFERLGVDCIIGEAKILSPHQIKVGNRILTTKNIAIATGASPAIPKIPGIENIPFLTSDTLWNLKIQPRRLLILGGGPIGCEMAQSFSRLGSEVTLIERGPQLLSREDHDVAEFVFETLKADGVKIFLNTNPISFDASAGSRKIICEGKNGNVHFEFDEILITLGRKPNLGGLGLENVGITLSGNGTVEVDSFLRSLVCKNIYFCGDVIGPYQFTHAASYQAWHVAVNSLFSPFKKFKVDYNVMPWCTFVDPEVARVGLNEKEAVAAGINHQVTRFNFSSLDRAITDGEGRGFVKVITAGKTDKILGATIAGNHAGEILSEFVAAMKHGFGLNKILGTVHSYPTYSEATKLAAGAWKKANAPLKVLSFLSYFHKWRRS